MAKRRNIVKDLFYKHIKNTPPKAIVVLETVYVCRLTETTLKIIELFEAKVHVNSKVLKHLYDKRPAEEFDFIIRNLHKIIKYPDRIYKNKTSKSGDHCLVKNIEGSDYICSIQYSCLDDEAGRISVVTAFRIRDEDYLKNYELLWSWKGGTPSS